MPVSGVTSTFANVTLNGPGGGSINPNEFPISSVAIDTSDTSGRTAYVTIMGFIGGGGGHVWKTTNAGATWTDFTGSGADALRDAPANAVIVDAGTVYVGTDVGVFQSSTASANWTEVGPVPNPMGGSTGFLPNVAVTALALFDSGGETLLRASTYGRGVWQFDLVTVPDFVLSGAVPTVNAGNANPQGSISVASINGFTGTVNLSCSMAAGDGSCSVKPASVSSFPATADITISAPALGAGSYQLSVRGASGSTINTLAIPFNVADYQLSGTESITINAGSQGAANLTIVPSPFYVGLINASCNSSALAGATCTASPANPISVSGGSAVPVAALIKIPAAVAGTYKMTFDAQDTTGNPNHSLTIAVTVPPSTANSFQLASTQNFPPAVDAGSQTIAKAGITANYSGSINATCDASTFSGQCSITPGNPVKISAGIKATLTLTLNVPNSAAPKPSNSYSVKLTATDSSGQPSQTLTLPLTVIQDFAISSLTPATQTITSGESASYNFSVLPAPPGASFANAVSLSCSGAPAPLCNFTPNSVTPGNSSVAVVMQVNTASGSANVSPLGHTGVEIMYALCLALPGLALTNAHRRKRSKLSELGLVASLLGLFLLVQFPACGGGGSNGGSGSSGQQQGTKPGTYTITVTGTSGTLSHQAFPLVSLIVNP
jgi:hypothetical protein